MSTKKMLKKTGFTLIELMISSTIAIVVMVISFALITNVYLARKQIRIAQNFYSESRFLLERIASLSRDNTIDYSRFFEEIGPSDCSSFSSSQGGPSHTGSSNKTNNAINRMTLGYSNIFYWEISDNIYRNLGGVNKDGDIDNCSQSFHGNLDILYLVSKNLDIRTAVKNNSNRVQTSIELGSDSDNDGIADKWGSTSEWTSGNTCVIKAPYSDGSNSPISLNSIVQNEDLCNQAHDFENISAEKLNIDIFSFTPYPDRDPLLSFRNDYAQIHPNIFLFMKVDLKDYDKFGFEEQPTITMQTSTSSRVFKSN